MLTKLAQAPFCRGFAVCVTFFMLQLGVSAQTYRLTHLGALLGGTNSFATGVNDSGHVVGYWNTLTNGIHAFLYTNNAVTDLGQVSGTNAFALSINALGDIAGFMEMTNGVTAFLYSNGSFTNLGPLGGINSFAYSLNTNIQIAGYIETTNGLMAIVYSNGGVTNLGTLGGSNSIAFSINRSNQVAGASLISGDTAYNAFFWDGAVLTNLNALVTNVTGWQLIEARGINDALEIVGYGITNSQSRAFQYFSGALMDLGFLGGGTNSYAFALNRSNQVAGTAGTSDGTMHAVIWNSGAIFDLNEAAITNSGWSLREARGINSGGQVIGWGIYNNGLSAFLLTPNIPPSVSITSPTNNSSYAAPVDVIVTASASDSDGSIAQVEYFQGNTSLGIDATSPYSVTWKNPTVGSYSLTAVATDDLGLKTTSSVVNVAITLPQLASLKVWLKADAITGTNNGDGIGTWIDSSGNANSATQTTVASRPIFLTNIFNGKPGVHFDGTNHTFNLPTFLTGATQAEAFVVLKTTADVPSGDRGLWRFGNNGTRYPLSSGIVADDFGSTTLNTIGDLSQPLDTAHLYNVSSKANDWCLRINGVLQFQNLVNTFAVQSSPTLGSIPLGKWAGDMAEVVVYNRVLTVAERDAIGRYLNAKYAFTSTQVTAPALFAKAISSNQISLTWTGAIFSAKAGFTIERKQGAGAYAVITNVENSASFLDGGLLAGTAYTYRITKSTFGGDSDYSNEASATTSLSQVSMPIAELRLWLKADAVEETGSLSFWGDQSGNTNHAIQSGTSGLRPQLVEGAINGNPVVRFDGTNDSFTLPNLLVGSTQAEAFVVLKATSDSPTSDKALWKFSSGGTRYPLANKTIADDFASTTLNTLGDVAQSLDGVHLYNVSSKANDWSARINGILQFQNSANTFSVYATPLLGSGVSGYFAGDVAEILIYRRVLTVAERDAVGRYLNDKYAFAIAQVPIPTISARAISSNQISLTWTCSVVSVKAGFTIERKQGAGSYQILTNIENTASFLDDGLLSGTQYTYRITASAYSGDSDYSNEAVATTSTNQQSMPLDQLKLWLKGDAIQEVGQISFWGDQSGNTNHVTQTGTSSARPEARTNVFNGRPVVHFDAVNDFFNLPNLFSGATQAEVFVVLKATADASAGGTRSLWRIGSYSGWGGAYPAGSGASLGDDFANNAFRDAGVPGMPISRVNLYNIYSKSGDWGMFLNGLALYKTNVNTVAFWNPMTLGSSGGFFDGDIAEILMYRRTLATQERDAVAAYLAHKYAFVAIPPTPSNLVASAISSNQVSLSWSTALTNSKVYFQIERKLSGGTFQQITTLVNSASYIDSTVTNGATYVYRVVAQNAAGDSDYSNEATVALASQNASVPMSDMRLWVKADSGTGGGTVRVWEDQSGQGNNFSQMTSNARPVVVWNAALSQPLVRFNGANSEMIAFRSPATNNFTVYFVARTTNSHEIDAESQTGGAGGTGQRYILDAFGSEFWGYGNGGVGISVGTNGVSDYEYQRNQIGSDYSPPLAVYSGTVGTNLTIAGLTYTNFVPSLYVNGTFARLGLASLRTNIFAPTRIGGNSAGHFGGDVAEVIVFGRALSSAERESVEGYLNNRFGVVQGTPSAPSNLLAYAVSSNQVSLTWAAGGPNPARFKIERKIGSGGAYSEIATVDGSETSFLDSGLLMGTTYYYRVRAVTLGGASSYSNEATATTPSSGVSLPTGNLALWLKADGQLNQDSSGKVNKWIDMSGANNNALQSTAASQPQNLTNHLNGRPAIRFDGVNDNVSIPKLSPSNNFTVVTVVRTTNSHQIDVEDNSTYSSGGGSGQRYLLGGQIYFGSGSEVGVSLGTNGVSVYEYARNQEFWDAYAAMAVYSGAVGTGFNVVSVRYESAQPSIYFDGALARVGLPSLRAPVTFPTLIGGGSIGYFGGDLPELMVFNRTLDNAEQLAVERYLNLKYGIISSAPVAPSNLVATAVSSNQISLTWAAGQQNVVLFRILRKMGSGGSYQEIATVGSMVSSYFDSNLQANTQYYYVVQAANLAGDSAFSNETNATTSATITAVPTSKVVLWLKADGDLNIDGSSKVNKWVDSSGRTNNALQSTTNAQPLYVLNQANARPVIRFDGIDDQLGIPKVPGSNNITIVVVAQTTNIHEIDVEDGSTYSAGGGSGQRFLLGGQTYSGSGSEVCLSFATNGISVYEYARNQEFWDAVAAMSVFSGSVGQSFAIASVSYSNRQPNIYFNGALTRTGLTSTRDPVTPPRYIGGVTNSAFQGDIAEILFFDGTLTTSERLTLESYLATKYAVVATAPGSPLALAATAISSNQISLTWTQALDDAAGFRVERKLGSGGTYQEITSVGAKANAFLDFGLAANSTYFYRVKAYNLAGATYSSGVSATTTNRVEMPLTNVVLWFRADGDLNKDGAGRINKWLDGSGLGNHAFQSSTDSQPVVVAGQINGRPVIRFDGSNDNVAALVIPATNDFTVIAVARTTASHEVDTEGTATGGGSGQRYLFDPQGPLAGQDKSSAGFSVGTNGLSVYEFQYNTVGFNYGPPTAVYSNDIGSSFSILAFGYTGREASIFRNNILVQHGTPYSRDPLFAPVRIGGSPGMPGAFLGDVAEVLIFNKVLSGDEEDTLGLYLNSKYALLTNAPVLPTNLVATAVAFNQLRVSWTNDAPAISTLYDLERKLGTNGTYSVVGTVRDALSYLDFSVVPGSNYFYRITARNILESHSSTGIAPPSLTITNPLSQTIYSSGTNVVVAAAASDSDGSVIRVEFYDNGVLVGTTTNSHSITLTNLARQLHQLLAKATDEAGNSRYSAIVQILIPPDYDGDGIDDYTEVMIGISPYLVDTDGDGVSDSQDAFPLDPTRWTAPSPNPSDTTPPVITLEEPLGAGLLP